MCYDSEYKELNIGRQSLIYWIFRLSLLEGGVVIANQKSTLCSESIFESMGN